MFSEKTWGIIISIGLIFNIGCHSLSKTKKQYARKIEKLQRFFSNDQATTVPPQDKKNKQVKSAPTFRDKNKNRNECEDIKEKLTDREESELNILQKLKRQQCLLRRRAERGDNLNADELNLIARGYETGAGGLKRNHAKSIEYYKKAAEKGRRDAYTVVGDHYQNHGNVAKAEEMYEEAAERGEIESQKQLIKNSLDRNQSHPNAIKWLERGSLNGDQESQIMLGNIYLKGIGTEKDLKKAGSEFIKAHISGPDPNLKLEGSYGLGLVSKEKGEFQNAAKWFMKGANKHPGSTFELAKMHEKGEGFPMNPIKACLLYAKAGLKGIHEANQKFAELSCLDRIDSILPAGSSVTESPTNPEPGLLPGVCDGLDCIDLFE